MIGILCSTWDNTIGIHGTMISNVIKHKFKLWESTPTAMIIEDTLNFVLGSALNTTGESLGRALPGHLETPYQASSLTKEYIAKGEGTNLHIMR